MDFLIKTLLWGIACFIGALLAYMAHTHQQIRWKRERGLLVRESYAFYWATLEFFKKYKWLIVVMIIGAITAALVPANSWQTLVVPHPDTLMTPQKTESGEMKMDELKEWVSRLEDRRREFPQDYCSSVESGVASFGQVKEPSSVIKLKLRYLKSEYQKHCQPTAIK